jgi:protoporphyrinogen oxidase
MMERRTKERIAVVGGGVLGMTLAHRLAQAGKNVTLFEAAGQLGGLASAWQVGDVVWDRHYHVTLMSDTHTRALLDELDLERDMRWVQTKTGFYTDGRLHSMSSSLEFLKFSPLGLVDKGRLAATILYASKIKDWKRLEQVPVSDWLRRLSGEQTFQKIWLPLLRAKLGENYRDTSAAFIWTTIARMYAARRSGLKREMFGYVPGGYARVLDTFSRKLFSERVYTKLGNPIKEIRKQSTGQMTLHYGDDTRNNFDRVIVTAAAPAAARMVQGLEEREQSRLKSIRYLGVLCASVLMKRPLAGYYVTNITDSAIPFTGVIEMSALVDRREFNGNHLVYLPKYLSPDDPMFELSDAEIEAKFIAGLEKMYPGFDRSDVLTFKVSRVRNVVALPTLNYSSLVPPMQSSIPGLYMVNSSQIVNGTLNVNESVQLAQVAASNLLAERHERPAQIRKTA